MPSVLFSAGPHHLPLPFCVSYTGFPLRSDQLIRSGLVGNIGLTLYVDSHVAAQVGIFIFTLEIVCAGVHVSFFSLAVVFEIVLYVIGHPAPPVVALGC
jgi:hypothetical protein